MASIFQSCSISKLLRGGIAAFSALVLVGCGGGGGSPGTVTGSGGVSKARIEVELVDANGVTTNKVTLSSPLTARAKVFDAAGKALPNTVVTFAVGSDNTVLAPSTGTGLTNSEGVASISLAVKDLATGQSQAGAADTLTASATVGSLALIGKIPFTIGATAITLRLVSPNPSTVSLKAYESTSIQVDVLSDGILYADQQTTVNFSSACATAGKVDLPASTATISGRAQVVYRDKGCSTTDTVTVSAAGAKPITAVMVVAPPVGASIGFVSAVPSDKAIVIKGSGGNGRTETATLTFLALDTAGRPLPNQLVTFMVNSTQPVSLQATSGITDTDGKVIVSVNSGTKPTTFRVIATLPGGQSTISDSITVTTGQPVQAAFSLSVESPNIEGWGYDNQKTKVNILLADQFGNPVADGTPIVFDTDSGAIGSASIGGCLTVNGGCSVDFRSQNPRFGLANAAGKRAGMATVNVSSTSSLVTLSGQTGIFLSGSFADNVFMEGGVKLDPFTRKALTTDACGVIPVRLELNDLNFNPMPVKTTVEAANIDKVTVQDIIPKEVLNVYPHTSTGAGTLIPGSMAARQGSVHTVPVKTSDKCVNGSTGYTETGTFDVKITTPIGNVTLYSFSLTYPVAAPVVTCVAPQVLQNGSCVIPASPTISIALSGTVVDSTHSVTASATVKDAQGVPQQNKLVTFTLNDATLAKFSPSSGTALTNTSGVATIQLVKVLPGGQGAATVTASTTVGTTSLAASASFAIGAAGSPTPVAINFVSAVPADKSIVIKGSGGSGRTEVALLTFNVVDSTNSGVGNVGVSFSLVTNPGVPSALPSFSGQTTTTGITDQSGMVTVSLNSGTDPTTVRVVAAVTAQPSITAISDTVTVTTGQPTQPSFSMSFAKNYIEGLEFDNISNNVLVLLADQFGGAVADGTQVVFTTDAGAIVGTGGAKCLTGQTNDGPGACHVTWRSQNPRPASGVASITATATAAGANLSITRRFYFSGSKGFVYQVGNSDVAGSTSRIGGAGVFNFASFLNCQPQTVRIEVIDVNGNPMPEGTVLSAVNANNASGVFFPATVVRNGLAIPTAGNRGTVHDMTVAPVGCTVGGLVSKAGFFDISVKTPLGVETYTRVSLGNFNGS